MYKQLLSILLITVLAGCGASVQEDGSINIPISLTESTVNDLLSQAIANIEADGQRLQVQNLRVDLQAGQIVVNGDFGQPPTPGSLTVSVTADGQQVVAAVTSVNIAGIDPNDARIQQVNDAISRALGGQVASGQSGTVRVVAASVTDDALSITINVRSEATPGQ